MSVIGADVAKARSLAAEMYQQLTGIRELLDGLAKDMRRGHIPQTLAENVEWEREFGAEWDVKSPSRTEPAVRRELCKHLARKYGVTYATVRAAFTGVWS